MAMDQYSTRHNNEDLYCNVVGKIACKREMDQDETEKENGGSEGSSVNKENGETAKKRIEYFKKTENTKKSAEIGTMLNHSTVTSSYKNSQHGDEKHNAAKRETTKIKEKEEYYKNKICTDESKEASVSHLNENMNIKEERMPYTSKQHLERSNNREKRERSENSESPKKYATENKTVNEKRSRPHYEQKEYKEHSSGCTSRDADESSVEKDGRLKRRRVGGDDISVSSSARHSQYSRKKEAPVEFYRKEKVYGQQYMTKRNKCWIRYELEQTDKYKSHHDYLCEKKYENMYERRFGDRYERSTEGPYEQKYYGRYYDKYFEMYYDKYENKRYDMYDHKYKYRYVEKGKSTDVLKSRLSSSPSKKYEREENYGYKNYSKNMIDADDKYKFYEHYKKNMHWKSPDDYRSRHELSDARYDKYKSPHYEDRQTHYIHDTCEKRNEVGELQTVTAMRIRRCEKHTSRSRSSSRRTSRSSNRSSSRRSKLSKKSKLSRRSSRRSRGSSTHRKRGEKEIIYGSSDSSNRSYASKSSRKSTTRRRCVRRSLSSSYRRGKIGGYEKYERDKNSSRSKERSRNKSSERSRDRSRNKSSEISRDRSRNKSSEISRDRSRNKSSEISRDRSRNKSSEISRDRSRNKSSERSRDRSRNKSNEISRVRSRNESSERSRDRSRNKSSEISRDRSRNKSSERSRDRSRNKSSERSRDRSENRSRDKSRNSSRAKKKYRSRNKSTDSYRNKSRDIGRYRSRNASTDRSRDIRRYKNRERIKDKNTDISRYRSRAKSRDGYKKKSRYRSGYRSRAKSKNRSRDISRYKSRYRSRAKSRDRSRDRSRYRSRYKSTGRDREKQREKSAENSGKGSTDRSRSKSKSSDTSTYTSRSRSTNRRRPRSRRRSRDLGDTNERTVKHRSTYRHYPNLPDEIHAKKKKVIYSKREEDKYAEIRSSASSERENEYVSPKSKKIKREKKRSIEDSSKNSTPEASDKLSYDSIYKDKYDSKKWDGFQHKKYKKHYNPPSEEYYKKRNDDAIFYEEEYGQNVTRDVKNEKADQYNDERQKYSDKDMDRYFTKERSHYQNQERYPRDQENDEIKGIRETGDRTETDRSSEKEEKVLRKGKRTSTELGSVPKRNREQRMGLEKEQKEGEEERERVWKKNREREKIKGQEIEVKKEEKKDEEEKQETEKEKKQGLEKEKKQENEKEDEKKKGKENIQEEEHKRSNERKRPLKKVTEENDKNEKSQSKKSENIQDMQQSSKLRKDEYKKEHTINDIYKQDEKQEDKNNTENYNFNKLKERNNNQNLKEIEINRNEKETNEFRKNANDGGEVKLEKNEYNNTNYYIQRRAHSEEPFTRFGYAYMLHDFNEDYFYSDKKNSFYRTGKKEVEKEKYDYGGVKEFIDKSDVTFFLTHKNEDIDVMIKSVDDEYFNWKNSDDYKMLQFEKEKRKRKREEQEQEEQEKNENNEENQKNKEKETMKKSKEEKDDEWRTKRAKYETNENTIASLNQNNHFPLTNTKELNDCKNDASVNCESKNDIIHIVNSDYSNNEIKQKTKDKEREREKEKTDTQETFEKAKKSKTQSYDNERKGLLTEYYFNRKNRNMERKRDHLYLQHASSTQKKNWNNYDEIINKEVNIEDKTSYSDSELLVLEIIKGVRLEKKQIYKSSNDYYSSTAPVEALNNRKRFLFKTLYDIEENNDEEETQRMAHSCYGQNGESHILDDQYNEDTNIWKKGTDEKIGKGDMQNINVSSELTNTVGRSKYYFYGHNRKRLSKFDEAVLFGKDLCIKNKEKDSYKNSVLSPEESIKIICRDSSGKSSNSNSSNSSRNSPSRKSTRGSKSGHKVDCMLKKLKLKTWSDLENVYFYTNNKKRKINKDMDGLKWKTRDMEDINIPHTYMNSDDATTNTATNPTTTSATTFWKGISKVPYYVNTIINEMHSEYEINQSSKNIHLLDLHPTKTFCIPPKINAMMDGLRNTTHFLKILEKKRKARKNWKTVARQILKKEFAFLCDSMECDVTEAKIKYVMEELKSI